VAVQAYFWGEAQHMRKMSLFVVKGYANIEDAEAGKGGYRP